MRRTGKALVGMGWRGLFALVSGVVSLTGLGVAGCGGNFVLYGPPPYGSNLPGDASTMGCSSTPDCGKGWYCDSSHSCVQQPLDGGTSDAGK
jgi:hypothetical protein